MTIEKRILLSIPIGWLLAGILLLTAFNIESRKIASVLLWNVSLFLSLAGDGPILGDDALGNQRYEGTPVHAVFAFVGALSSFFIYPLIVFLILSIANKFYSRKKPY